MSNYKDYCDPNCPYVKRFESKLTDVERVTSKVDNWYKKHIKNCTQCSDIYYDDSIDSLSEIGSLPDDW